MNEPIVAESDAKQEEQKMDGSTENMMLKQQHHRHQDDALDEVDLGHGSTSEGCCTSPTSTGEGSDGGIGSGLLTSSPHEPRTSSESETRRGDDDHGTPPPTLKDERGDMNGDTHGVDDVETSKNDVGELRNGNESATDTTANEPEDEDAAPSLQLEDGKNDVEDNSTVVIPSVTTILPRLPPTETMQPVEEAKTQPSILSEISSEQQIVDVKPEQNDAIAGERTEKIEAPVLPSSIQSSEVTEQKPVVKAPTRSLFESVVERTIEESLSDDETPTALTIDEAKASDEMAPPVVNLMQPSADLEGARAAIERQCCPMCGHKLNDKASVYIHAWTRHQHDLSKDFPGLFDTPDHHHPPPVGSTANGSAIATQPITSVAQGSIVGPGMTSNEKKLTNPTPCGTTLFKPENGISQQQLQLLQQQQQLLAQLNNAQMAATSSNSGVIRTSISQPHMSMPGQQQHILESSNGQVVHAKAQGGGVYTVSVNGGGLDSNGQPHHQQMVPQRGSVIKRPLEQHGVTTVDLQTGLPNGTVQPTKRGRYKYSGVLNASTGNGPANNISTTNPQQTDTLAALQQQQQTLFQQQQMLSNLQQQQSNSSLSANPLMQPPPPQAVVNGNHDALTAQQLLSGQLSRLISPVTSTSSAATLVGGGQPGIASSPFMTNRSLGTGATPQNLFGANNVQNFGAGNNGVAGSSNTNTTALTAAAILQQQNGGATGQNSSSPPNTIATLVNLYTAALAAGNQALASQYLNLLQNPNSVASQQLTNALQAQHAAHQAAAAQAHLLQLSQQLQQQASLIGQQQQQTTSAANFLNVGPTPTSVGGNAAAIQHHNQQVAAALLQHTAGAGQNGGLTQQQQLLIAQQLQQQHNGTNGGLPPNGNANTPVNVQQILQQQQQRMVQQQQHQHQQRMMQNMTPHHMTPTSSSGATSLQQCERCGFVARSSDELARHIQEHVPRVSQKCATCQMVFPTAAELNIHFLTKHQIQPPKSSVANGETQSSPAQRSTPIVSGVVKEGEFGADNSPAALPSLAEVATKVGSSPGSGPALSDQERACAESLLLMSAQSSSSQNSPTTNSEPVASLPAPQVTPTTAGQVTKPKYLQTGAKVEGPPKTLPLYINNPNLSQQERELLLARSFQESADYCGSESCSGDELLTPPLKHGTPVSERVLAAVRRRIARPRVHNPAFVESYVGAMVPEGHHMGSPNGNSNSMMNDNSSSTDMLLPYKCGICHYRARWPSEITQHMKNHSTDKPFKCPHCKYCSKWKWDVVKHMKRCKPPGGTLEDVIYIPSSGAGPNIEVAPRRKGPPNVVLGGVRNGRRTNTVPTTVTMIGSPNSMCSTTSSVNSLQYAAALMQAQQAQIQFAKQQHHHQQQSLGLNTVGSLIEKSLEQAIASSANSHDNNENGGSVSVINGAVRPGSPTKSENGSDVDVGDNFTQPTVPQPANAEEAAIAAHLKRYQQQIAAQQAAAQQNTTANGGSMPPVAKKQRRNNSTVNQTSTDSATNPILTNGIINGDSSVEALTQYSDMQAPLRNSISPDFAANDAATLPHKRPSGVAPSNGGATALTPSVELTNFKAKVTASAMVGPPASASVVSTPPASVASSNASGQQPPAFMHSLSRESQIAAT